MKVLIVEDSGVVRQLLRAILEQGGLEVIGEAENGEEALVAIRRQRPDVITMDIHMPIMDGYECTRRIMETDPIPILVVTGSNNIQDSEFALRTMEAGAVTVVEKPRDPDHPDFDADAATLVKMVRNIGEIKLVRRIRRDSSPSVPRNGHDRHPTLVAIGASTGGPVALKALLSGLEPAQPWPFLVVQHISQGFLPGFCEWLNSGSKLPVRIAEYGEEARAGHVYLAADHHHMTIDADRRIRLLVNNTKTNLCPSVSALFDSVSQNWGRQSVAILLSGMGRDGVHEMLALKNQGALTLAQDADTCVVNGMPGEAVKAGAATHVLTPEAMAEFLNHLARTPRTET